MKGRITREEVARLAGVSVATVSYVLNARTDKPIREETGRRVLQAAQQLGYRPNRAARSLASGQTYLIAVWLPRLNSPYYAEKLHLIHDRLLTDGYEIFLVCGSPENMERVLAHFSPGMVDGIIDTGCPDLVEAFVKSGHSAAIPMVSVGAFASPLVDSVGIDLYGGMSEAVRHLLAGGRQRIAFLTPSDPRFHYPAEPRFLAYQQVMREAGLKPHCLYSEATDPEGVRREFLSQAAQHPCPEGIVCYNDEMAIGVHRALLDLGIKIPDDVGLVGHDGILYTDFLSIRLSTVAHPLREMCDLGWDFLRLRMEKPDRPRQQVVLPSKLIVRDSSR